MKEGWPYKKLGECLSYIKNGANIKQTKGAEGIPITRIETLSGGVFNRDRLGYANIFTTEKYSQYIMDDGDILMSHINSKAYIGRAVLYRKEDNEQIIHGMNLLRLKVIPTIIHPNFINIFFKSYYFRDRVAKIRKDAVNQSSMAISDLVKIPIPIPPLAEQERIVAELDLLSSIIEKKKAQLKEYDQLAQSIFYDMFGDPITNEKGWEVKTIGDTCSITCGQDYKSVKDDNGQYPIYGTGGIMGWANQYRCPKHSVIIGRKGNINNPILVDVDFWNVDTAFCITSKNEELKVVYFFFFCKEYDFTKHDVSVTIPSLRRIDILKIKFPLPPLPLQQEFASKIEAIERQKSLIQQSIVETQTLFDSRMDHWFG